MKNKFYSIITLLFLIISNTVSAQIKQTRAQPKCIAQSYLSHNDNFASPLDSFAYNVDGLVNGIDPTIKIFEKLNIGNLPSTTNRLQYNSHAYFLDTTTGGAGCPFQDSVNFTVDANNNILSKKLFTNGGILQGIVSYTYDANSILQSSFDSSFTYAGNLYKKNYRYQNIGGTDLLVSITSTYGIVGAGGLKFEYIDSFTHSASGDYLEKSETYKEDPSFVLKVKNRNVFHRGTGGRVDSFTTYNSNYPYNTLDAVSRNYYTYSTVNGLINTINTKKWNTSLQQFSDLYTGDTLIYSGTNSYPDTAWTYTFDQGFGGMRLTNLYKYNYNAKKQLVAFKNYYSNYPTANTMYVNNIQNFYYAANTPDAIANNNVQSINIYPNPVTDFIIIKDIDADKNAIVFVFNIDGKLILQQNLSNTNIDISNLPKGLYFLQIQADGKIYNSKFSKR
jgi:Secretion system C-terminal sorting domain